MSEAGQVHPLFKGRWLVGHVIIVTLSVGMVFLGFWQLERLGQVKDDNRAAAATIGQAPRPLQTAPGPGVADFTPVVVEGRLISPTTVFQGYPIMNGRPGFEVLQVLELADGSQIVADLGWTPQETGASLARPQQGTQTVRLEGYLVRPEKGSGRVSNNQGNPPVPVVTHVDPQQLAPLTASRPARQWLQVSNLVPGVAGSPVPLPPPSLSEGSHFSYALQWFSFAAIAVAGWTVLCLRSRRAQ